MRELETVTLIIIMDGEMRDSFEDKMEEDEIDALDAEEALLADDDLLADDEEEDEDKLLGQFGLHVVEEDEPEI